MKKLLQLALASTLIPASSSLAQSIELVIGSDRGASDDPVVVPVTVDDSSGIIGASFLVSFDTAALDVMVSSDFFAPFIEQLEDAENMDDMDNFGDVGGVQYNSPIVTTAIPGEGMAVSGIRLEPADGSNTTLFHLAFTKKDETSDGTFPVSIEPLTIMDVDAGYPVEGLDIPALVGLDGSDYPVLLSPEDFPEAVTPGEVDFLAVWIDSDDDGIPDPWELFYFESLETAHASSDIDGDELRDLVEYLLGTNPEIQDGPTTFKLQLDAGNFDFFFPLRDLHDIDYQVQWSTDANVWNTANVSLMPRPDIGTGADWTYAQASITPGGEQSTILARLVLMP